MAELSHQSDGQAMSKRAREIMHQLVTVQGLSYVDAVRRCEETAGVVARKARAPYDEVASTLREALDA